MGWAALSWGSRAWLADIALPVGQKVRQISGNCSGLANGKLVFWWMCGPELGILMGVSYFLPVATLVRCTVLFVVCWFLLSLCLNRVSLSFMSFLDLCGPGSVFYCTQLNWEGELMLPPPMTYLYLYYPFSSFLHFPSILSITLLLSLETSLAIHTLLLGWEKLGLLSFHTSSFSTYPFALLLTFAPVLFCIFLSTQLILSNQLFLFLWHLKPNPPSLLLQKNHCRVP